MKTIIAFIAYFFIVIYQAHAQRETANWTFSDSILLSFNDNGQIQIAKANVDTCLYFTSWMEAQSTLSDKNGNLLFYFNPGCSDTSLKSRGTIFNKFNQRIINGDSIKTNYSITNGALFLPTPRNQTQFYFFSLSNFYNYYDGICASLEKDAILYYSIIDTSTGYETAANIQKNIPLTGCENLSEKMTAIRHANGQDWWLLLYNYKTMRFITFLIDATGIHGPFEHIIPNFYTLCAGCTDLVYGYNGEMSVSPSGEKIGMVGSYGYWKNSQDYAFKFVDMFDFDRCTGKLSNHKVIEREELQGMAPYNYGCAFAPKENYLYVNTYKDLYRFSVSGQIQKDTIYENIYTPDSLIWGQFAQEELGPDGKIYIVHRKAAGNGTDVLPQALSVITQPDETDCAFAPFSIPLGPGKRASGGLPHFPNFGLGALVPPGTAEAGPDRVACTNPVAIGTPALPGMVYRWRPATGLSDTTAATPLAAPQVSTTYTLTVWDSVGGLCGAVSDTVRVWVNELPVPVNFTYTIDGFNVFFTSTLADTINYTVKWYFGDGDSSLLKNPAHTYADTGYYAVTLVVTDTSGCSVTLTQNIPLGVPNDILPLLSQKPFKIYPNPTDGHLTIQCSVKNTTVELLDNNGRVLLSEKVPPLIRGGKGGSSFDLSRFAKGVYYVRLVKGLNDIVGVEKIVLE